MFHPEEGTLSVLHVEERGADVGMAAVSQIGVQKVELDGKECAKH